MVRCDLERVGRDHAAVDRVAGGLHVEPHRLREQPAEGLEDAAGELPIVGVVEQFAQQRHTEHEADPIDVPGGEVFTEVVEGPDVAHEHHSPDHCDQIDAGQKVGVVGLPPVAQIVHRDLHDLDDLAALPVVGSAKILPGCREHLEVQPGHGGEAAAFHEHAGVPQCLRGEHGHTVGVEEDRVGGADPHEVQGEKPVVGTGKRGPPHREAVDLEPFAADVLEQRFGHRLRLAPAREHRMEHVDAEPAERFLLEGVGGIEQPAVDHHVARFGPKRVLKPHPEPGVALVPAGVGSGGGGVREREKPRPIAPGGIEPLAEQGKLVVEHLLDPLPRHIPRRLAVDGIAHGHVVGRHRLGDGAGGTADREKPAGHLLPGTDLGEGAVDRAVEIDGERPFGRGIKTAVHGGQGCYQPVMSA